jgi:glycosyltransferase involved in cell wall biosynthesis
MERTRIVLWSAKGSTTRYYGGPGIGSYRLYRWRDHQATALTLAHGSRLQPEDREVFDDQALVYPLFFLGTGGGRSGAGAPADLGQVELVRNPYEHVVRKALFVLKARAWLAENAKRFDVFHGLGAHIDTLAPATYAEQCGLPAVISTVIEEELTLGSPLSRLIGVHRWRLKMLPGLSALVAISREIRERLVGLGVPEDKIVELPLCGVDTVEFRPLAAGESKGDARRALALADRPTCIFAGHVVPRKRPDLLIPAIAEARTRGIDCQLVLAGPEEDESYGWRMREDAERLGVTDRVVWLGFTQRVSELLRASDVLALPSTSEGLPGVVMEAMACGIPCVYTNISGARDLIDDNRDGRIIAANGDGLAEALAAYLADPALALDHGRRARDKAEARFSNRAVLAGYLRVFDNVRNRRPPGL